MADSVELARPPVVGTGRRTIHIEHRLSVIGYRLSNNGEHTMCGIIGYIGDKKVLPILIDGLRRLEYRGYDSAGVAVVRDGQIELRRSAGKLARLEAVIDGDPIDGEYGVGHNGIIENYLDLKRDLQRDGHRFVTETDTEIVAHLVEREMRDDGLEQAVRRALAFMRGMFALVLVSVNDPEK